MVVGCWWDVGGMAVGWRWDGGGLRSGRGGDTVAFPRKSLKI
jgi:hypothetical protein